ncbi:MAG: TonB-dependent receptor [Gammaproteobacteria bacterium]|nr:TonB-dependent receptor [Gammaproteobacteria bacterium]
MLRIQSTGVRAAVRGVLCSAFACGVPAALADQAEAPPPTAAAQPREVTPFEEIVVTAQRREQNIQDVGIAVTPLDERALQNLNITTATDIVKAVPNLRMNAYSSAQVVFNIRGVSQNDYGDQQEPPVAVYQDDSYSSSINLAGFPVFDLARVETLRGPQGTLFGRNATGGAIQFISNAPTEEFEGYGNVTVGRFNQVIVDGALSGPLSDNLQGRFAFIVNQDDGWMKNIDPTVPDIGGNDHYALRGRLAWQPGEATDVNLIVRYLKADGETQAGLYSHEPACPNDQFQGFFTPADYACPFWGTGPGESGTGFQEPSIIPSRGGDPYKTAETEPSYVDRKILAGQLRVDTDVGAGTFTSITDYQTSDKFYTEGGDSSPDDGVYFFQGAELDQVSQEFRYAWSSGQHQTVVGLYGMYVDGDYIGKFASRFYGYDPDVTMAQETVSYAAFIQDEWSFAEGWKLTGGLRYWNDEREGAYRGVAPPIPDLAQPQVLIVFNTDVVSPVGSGVTPDDAKQSFDDFTARVQLDFRPNDDLLWYASYNRGSKSGGFTFSTGTPFDPNQFTFLQGLVFEPETLNAYEIGMKSSLAGGTMMLNVAGFYYDYDDYQAFAQLGPVQTVLNQDAEATGLEIELNARPTDGLLLQISGALMDSEVKDILLPDTVTIVDHDLPQAPSFAGNALVRYEFAVGSGIASIQGDVYYTDGFCFTVLCAPVEEEESYTVANARIGYAAADGRWEVAAFVNNLFEEEYRVYAFDSSLFAGVVAGVYAKPRTYGLTASWRFGAGYE